MKTFIVKITDSAEIVIDEAECENDAIAEALMYWDERMPKIEVKEIETEGV